MKDSSDKECKDRSIISIVILYKTGPVKQIQVRSLDKITPLVGEIAVLAHVCSLASL